MLAAHLVNVNDMEPTDLCNYLEHKYYMGIRQSLQTVDHYLAALSTGSDAVEHIVLPSLLYSKLKDETEQLLRNDTLVIFPLIRNDKGSKPCTGRKLPVDLIHTMHQKIIQLMDRIRQQSNNYISQASWSNMHKIFINELYQLEQQIQQIIFIKENILLKKVEQSFNQDCKASCHKDS